MNIFFNIGVLVSGIPAALPPLTTEVFYELVGWGKDGLVPPVLYGDLDEPMDETPLGPLMLGLKIHQGQQARIYEGKIGDLEYIVKYGNDCMARSRVSGTADWTHEKHPIFVEGMFLAALNNTGVSPKVFYLSPHAVIDQGIYYLLTRHYSDYLFANYQSCLTMRSAVRFTVQERVGTALSSYVDNNIINRKPSAKRTLKLLVLLRNVIGLLERLHQYGIAHGDIHFGNIAFMKPPTAETRLLYADLVLLDFEFASYATGEEHKVDHFISLPERHRSLKLLSPWQLTGQPTGFRDDMYRLFFHVASALSKGEILDKPSRAIKSDWSFEDRVEGWRDYHRDLTMFKKAKFGSEVSKEQSELLKVQLEELVDVIRELASPQTPAQYLYLQRQVDLMIGFIAGLLNP